jgi:hypothetical protein
VGASLFAVAWLVAWRFARLPATSAAAEPPLPSLDDTPAGV